MRKNARAAPIASSGAPPKQSVCVMGRRTLFPSAASIAANASESARTTRNMRSAIPSIKILDYKYRVALPAPTLYGQFNNLDDVDYVLTALKSMGFDDAFEVSRGAELVSSATRILMESGKLKKP